jgi:hypothetical protein
LFAELDKFVMSSKSMSFFGTFVLSLFLLFANNNADVLAEERKFLNLNLQFLGEYQLTESSYQDTKVGGFSGITYNTQKDEYYVISDDRSYYSPARFYTLKINIQENKIKDIDIKNVTFLKDEIGNNYPVSSIDTEGIALSPKNTLFISSEGVADKEIPPFINEFDLQGNFLKAVPIPQRYIPKIAEKKGIENNLGFESLAIKSNGMMNQEPFRLFTVTESALTQDIDLDNSETFNRSRLMHYVINPFGAATLVAEHLYQLDSPSFGTLHHGIPDLLTLPQEGHLLSIERSLGINGYGVKIFQIVMANASDTSNQESLAGNIQNINPIQKKLLLDLGTLDIQLDNLEGITLGPRLADGSRSLIIISDNNFSEPDKQKNQFLLFKLTGL